MLPEGSLLQPAPGLETKAQVDALASQQAAASQKADAKVHALMDKADQLLWKLKTNPDITSIRQFAKVLAELSHYSKSAQAQSIQAQERLRRLFSECYPFTHVEKFASGSEALEYHRRERKRLQDQLSHLRFSFQRELKEGNQEFQSLHQFSVMVDPLTSSAEYQIYLTSLRHGISEVTEKLQKKRTELKIQEVRKRQDKLLAKLTTLKIAMGQNRTLDRDYEKLESEVDSLSTLIVNKVDEAVAQLESKIAAFEDRVIAEFSKTIGAPLSDGEKIFRGASNGWKGFYEISGDTIQQTHGIKKLKIIKLKDDRLVAQYGGAEIGEGTYKAVKDLFVILPNSTIENWVRLRSVSRGRQRELETLIKETETSIAQQEKELETLTEEEEKKLRPPMKEKAKQIKESCVAMRASYEDLREELKNLQDDFAEDLKSEIKVRKTVSGEGIADLQYVEYISKGGTRKFRVFATKYEGDMSLLWGQRERAVLCCLHLLKGLNRLHSGGYVHGDVKILNALVLGNIAELTDFGLSSLLDKPIQWIGTADYMPPETMTSPCPAKFSQDMYSFGIVLLTLFAADLYKEWQQKAIEIDALVESRTEKRAARMEYEKKLAQLKKDFLSLKARTPEKAEELQKDFQRKSKELDKNFGQTMARIGAEGLAKAQTLFKQENKALLAKVLLHPDPVVSRLIPRLIAYNPADRLTCQATMKELSSIAEKQL